MKKNMGTVDKVIRVILAVLFVVLSLTGQVSGTLAIILGIAVFLFLLTSIIGFCPSYLPFKINTRKQSTAE